MDESKVHLIYAQTDACYQLKSYLLEVSSERLYSLCQNLGYHASLKAV
jgi:hypothetical protein